MTECLRFLRLGIINVLGITVPGLLLLSFFTVGFVIPVGVCALGFFGELQFCDESSAWEAISAFCSANRSWLLLFSVIVAYIAGYIMRLSTPDDLDKISADMILCKMGRESGVDAAEAAKKDVWPYQGEKDNKFPYMHFKEYLLSRGLQECAELVGWGQPADGATRRRSKTHVNMMKLEVQARSPELSAIIESNEAHIRLMFGTWIAVMTCRGWVMAGTVLSVVGLLVLAQFHGVVIQRDLSRFVICALLDLLLLVSMYWAKARIEHLFHYQRVRELMQIVGCMYCAREQQKWNQQRHTK